MSLLDVLKQAEAFGFDKRERHEIAWKYRSFVKEYSTIEREPHNNNNLLERMAWRDKANCYANDKTRAYIIKKIDEEHKL